MLPPNSSSSSSSSLRAGQMNLRLSIPKIIWMDSALISQYFGRSNSDGAAPSAEACICIRWWGDTRSDRRLLYPKSLPGHSISTTATAGHPTPQRPFIARFPVVTSKSQLERYFADMQAAVFDVLLLLPGGQERLVGRLRLTDFSALFQQPSRPINGFFPIYSVTSGESPSKHRPQEEPVKIGEAHVLIVLEDFPLAAPPFPSPPSMQQQNFLASSTATTSTTVLSAAGKQRSQSASDRENRDSNLLDEDQSQITNDQADVVGRLLNRARQLQVSLDAAIGRSFIVEANFSPTVKPGADESVGDSDSRLSVDNADVQLAEQSMLQDDEESLAEELLLIEALNAQNNADDYLRFSQSARSAGRPVDEFLDEFEETLELLDDSEAISDLKRLLGGKQETMIRQSAKDNLVAPQSSSLLLRLGRVDSLVLHLSAIRLTEDGNSKWDMASFELIIPGLPLSSRLQSAVFELDSQKRSHDINLTLANPIEFSDQLLQSWRKRHILIKSCLICNGSTASLIGVSGIACAELLSAKELRLDALELPIWLCTEDEQFTSDWEPPLEGSQVGKLQLSFRLNEVSPSNVRFKESARSISVASKEAEPAIGLLPPLSASLQNTYIFLGCRRVSGLEIPLKSSDSGADKVFLSTKLPLDRQPIESKHLLWQKPPNDAAIEFNFQFSSPLALSADQPPNSPLIIEVWFQQTGEIAAAPTLVGLVKLPLDRLIDLAQRQQQNATEKAQVLLPESEYCVIDPISGMAKGWAECILALGSISQIQSVRLEWQDSTATMISKGDSVAKRRDVTTNTSLLWLVQERVDRETATSFASLAAQKASVHSLNWLDGEHQSQFRQDAIGNNEQGCSAAVVDSFVNVIVGVDQAMHLPMKLHTLSNTEPGKQIVETAAPDTFVTVKWPSFVIGKTDKHEDRSSTVSHDTAPRWNYQTTVQFDCRAADSLARIRTDRLEFQVYSFSAASDTDGTRLIGVAKVDLSSLLFGLPSINGWYRLTDPRTGDQAGQIKISVQPLESLHLAAARNLPVVNEADTDHSSSKHPTDLQVELRQSIAALEQINDRLQGKLRASLFDRRQFHPSVSRASHLLRSRQQPGETMADLGTGGRQHEDDDGALHLADLMDEHESLQPPIVQTGATERQNPLFGGAMEAGVDSQHDIDTLVQNSEVGDNNSDDSGNLGLITRLPHRPLKSLLSPIRRQRSATDDTRRIERIFSANFDSSTIPPIPSSRKISSDLPKASQSDGSLDKLLENEGI